MEEITVTGYEGADMLDLINDEMEGKEEHKELGLEWKKIYRTGKDFLSEFGNGSVELNHCIHYSIREYKDKETGNGTNKYFGEFLILNQKKIHPYFCFGKGNQK